MKSLKSRKQRKEYFNAPLHKRRKWISSHLEENLLLKYDKRRLTLVKGDAVKVMRGSFKGHEGKITHVNQRKRNVEVEGLVMTKADGKKIPKPIHASNLLITKLNLTDRWRRKKLEKNLSEDVKKEIEIEAKEQIIETEKEKKSIEDKKKEEEKIEEDKKEATEKVIVEPSQKQKIPKESKKVDKKVKDEEKDKIKKKNIKKSDDKKNKDKETKNNKSKDIKNKKSTVSKVKSTNKNKKGGKEK